MSEFNGPWFPTIFSDKCDGCAKSGKPRCKVCGKQYWTNSEKDVCFDCES